MVLKTLFCWSQLLKVTMLVVIFSGLQEGAY